MTGAVTSAASFSCTATPDFMSEVPQPNSTPSSHPGRQVPGHRDRVDVPGQHDPLRPAELGPGHDRVAVTGHGQVTAARAVRPRSRRPARSSAPLTDSMSTSWAVRSAALAGQGEVTVVARRGSIARPGSLVPRPAVAAAEPAGAAGRLGTMPSPLETPCSRLLRYGAACCDTHSTSFHRAASQAAAAPPRPGRGGALGSGARQSASAGIPAASQASSATRRCPSGVRCSRSGVHSRRSERIAHRPQVGHQAAVPAGDLPHVHGEHGGLAPDQAEHAGTPSGRSR